MVGQGTKRRRKIAENFNRLSRVHERYRQTDGTAIAYSERERERERLCMDNRIRRSESKFSVLLYIMGPLSDARFGNGHWSANGTGAPHSNEIAVFWQFFTPVEL